MDNEQLASFEEVFTFHHPKILRYAERRLSSLTAAEDIAAEVFHAAWKQWQAQKPVVLPWLYRVASNKIIDQYRAAERTAGIEAALSRLAEEPVAKLDVTELMTLRAALLTLDERSREAIFLFYWEELSAHEIAQVFGCTRTTAWAVLSRARQRLRRLIGEGQALTPVTTEGVTNG